ncbi:MAG: hypothetical protein QME76_12435 [Bacillota bacterium]|nr:hypothetical protein [Bacillota bacterium]
MPTNRIQGYDVSVLITGPQGPELVGEYQEADFSIKEDVEEYEELGERIPAILDGPIKIEGKLKRGHILLDIIRRIWGTPALKRGSRIPPAPRFTIACSINAPEKGFVGRYRLLDCKISDLGLSVKAGKAVMEENIDFKAEGIETA